ncbi:MAG: IMPACT family protein [Cyclobacteriaceae bacterium]
MRSSFLTISKSGHSALREKGSRFLGFAFPVKDESVVRQRLDELKKEYFDATHHCYAWVLGPDSEKFRANDDGEPGHSAGDPILGQIRSKKLTNTLVVVIRYYGGTNLGVSGLIKAYKETAAAALNNAQVHEERVMLSWSMEFSYNRMSEVMKFVKSVEGQVTGREEQEICRLTVSLPADADPNSFVEKAMERGGGVILVSGL